MAKEQVLSSIMAAALCPFVPNLISLEFREGEENWSTDYQTWNKTSWSKLSINSRHWLIYLKSLMSRMASVSGSNWQENVLPSLKTLVCCPNWVRGLFTKFLGCFTTKTLYNSQTNHGNACDAPEDKEMFPSNGFLSLMVILHHWVQYLGCLMFLLQFWASPGSLQDPQ